MSDLDRPLSPHLSIYRWPITMALSILHRATGLGLSVGFCILAAWLFSAAAGPDAYAVLISWVGTAIGRILLIGWSFAFFFHLANGVRHLIWDTGHGLEIRQANASAWFVLIMSVVLTLLFWGIRS